MSLYGCVSVPRRSDTKLQRHIPLCSVHLLEPHKVVASIRVSDPYTCMESALAVENAKSQTGMNFRISRGDKNDQV